MEEIKDIYFWKKKGRKYADIIKIVIIINYPNNACVKLKITMMTIN